MKKSSVQDNLICSLTMPIYYITRAKKTLLGWNQITPMHRFTRNNVKKWYELLVLAQLTGRTEDRYAGEFRLELELFFPHARVDMSNICGVAEKFVLDSLQTSNVITNDNVNCHTSTSTKLGGRDTDNPRIEIKLYKTV